MRNVKTLFALLFCTTLFMACSVDDINEDDTATNQMEDVMATDGENNPPDPKGD